MFYATQKHAICVNCMLDEELTPTMPNIHIDAGLITGMGSPNDREELHPDVMCDDDSSTPP